MAACHKWGVKWYGGDSCVGYNHWGVSRVETCYKFDLTRPEPRLMYGAFNDYTDVDEEDNNEFKIYDFYDFKRLD